MQYDFDLSQTMHWIYWIVEKQVSSTIVKYNPFAEYNCLQANVWGVPGISIWITLVDVFMFRMFTIQKLTMIT